MDDHAKEAFTALTGGIGPNEFIEKVKFQKDWKASKAFLIENEALFKKIDSIKSKTMEKAIIVSDKEDSLREHSRSYGEKYNRPEDYLEAFNKYIKISKK